MTEKLEEKISIDYLPFSKLPSWHQVEIVEQLIAHLGLQIFRKKIGTSRSVDIKVGLLPLGDKKDGT